MMGLHTANALAAMAGSSLEKLHRAFPPTIPASEYVPLDVVIARAQIKQRPGYRPSGRVPLIAASVLLERQAPANPSCI